MAQGLIARLALAGLASVAAPAVALAQDVIYGADVGPTDIAVACFERRYTKSHLSAHPQQNVVRMTALVYRLPGTPETVLNMTVRFREGQEDQQIPIVCRTGSGGLSCNVECDGGAFSVTARDRNAVLVDLGNGIGGCDAGEPSFGADDKTFRLDRVDMAACSDLIWDDERRNAVLKAGGLNR
ncbi:hypothetical protein [Rhizobium sp. RU36D]|uniref:hypothetical protein n=1 Tax=Rhizobium sp. RU36D TaxID=1907415 RepID=UPI0009D89C3B|nr:hypothetical protein [Rhizobium sp. RU36D]SMD07772.1 hypothetical protein SAMN05880593_119117 [Rhizobium sp. RU36D]